MEIYGYCRSLFALKDEFFSAFPKKAIVLDVDQTFFRQKQRRMEKQNLDFLDKAKEYSIPVLLVTNNTGFRIRKEAKKFHLPLLSFAGKGAFLFRVRRFLEKNGFAPEDVLLAGDQLRTDGAAARKLGALFLFTFPLGKEDNILTRFFRRKETAVMENLIRNKKAGFCFTKGEE